MADTATSHTAAGIHSSHPRLSGDYRPPRTGESSDHTRESPFSPNIIPDRTSSAGFAQKPSKPVLRPMPEEDWLASGKPSRSTQRPDGTTSPNAQSPPRTTKSRALSDSGKTRSSDDRSRRRGLGEGLIFDSEEHWSRDKETILMGPYEYMFGHPGKDIRSSLITAFNAFLNVPEASLSKITKVIGMLHTASLLVDDVEDSSLLRRGIPVAHNIFGTAQTINSANYVYFKALEVLQEMQNPRLISIYTEELLNLHRGQGMDLYWRDTLTCPTEDDYLEMVHNKTGGLFRLAIKLMQAESSSSKNCVPLVNTIGLLFQILDDYSNLQSATYTANKGLAEDLTEGKFSYPIIHSIRTNPSNLELKHILKQKTKDEEVKRYAIRYMDQTGSFAYTRIRLAELNDKALKLVSELEIGEQAGIGDGIKSILKKLSVEEPTAAGAETLST